jgi:hypothetical protein
MVLVSWVGAGPAVMTGWLPLTIPLTKSKLNTRGRVAAYLAAMDLTGKVLVEDASGEIVGSADLPQP